MLDLPPVIAQERKTRMKPLKRTAAFQWLTAALSLVPLIRFAYLGQFSRLRAIDL